MTGRRRVALVAVSVSFAAAAPAAPAGAFPDHLLVTVGEAVAGSLAAVQLAPPWTASPDLAAVPPRSIARHAFGRHWVVGGSPADVVQVVDPATWSTLLAIPTGAGSDPRDVFVESPQAAWISRHGSAHLLVVDPATGAATDSLDLSVFADADGVPDMERLASDGTRLFVQIQRLDAGRSRSPAPPSLLAVVDLATRTLVDVDPVAPGVQAIRLTGLFPVNEMQLEGDRLYVMEQGEHEMIDLHGGIDVIDLVELKALGFLVTESELGGHADAFVLVSATKGYAITHTDWTLSSHVTPFARPGGIALPSAFDQVGVWIDRMAFDPATGSLFVPGKAAEGRGVHVIDVATDVVIGGPIDVGGVPHDVVVVRPATGTGVAEPGGEVGLRLAVAPNPFRGATVVTVRAGGPGGAGAACDLTVHDAAGRLVRRLAAGPAGRGAAGTSATWDGRDVAGRDVAPGVYFVRLATRGGGAARKVVRVE